MASAVVQDSPDIHRLSLAVEHSSSSSPFPSPGSPFFPPPRLGAHEFALPPGSLMRSIAARNTQDVAALSPGIVSPDEETTPTIPKPGQFPQGNASPLTPTPSASFQINGKTNPQIAVPEPLSNSIPPSPSSEFPSLTSSRPAPPSPAVSRRASAALSRRSSGAKSRRQSKVPQLQPQHAAEASSSSAATVMLASAPAMPQPKRRSPIIKIRDFAFPPSDERHVGRGADVPRANRPRYRSSVYSSRSSSPSSDVSESDDAEDQRGSWGSYRWNTLSTHFSWGAAPRDDEEDGPSRIDFERNFAEGSSPAEEESDPYDHEADDDDEDEDGPLVAGLYRALFVFEPEGTAEMALEEEQIVRVIGRGGGVGWAVVEKEGGGHALVPESYLELVEGDE